jgi:hypothetical protein
MGGSLEAFKLFCSLERPERVAASAKVLEEHEQAQKELSQEQQQQDPTTDKQKAAATTETADIESIPVRQEIKQEA